MIDTQAFLDSLLASGVERLAGVPCSFLGALINAAEINGVYQPFVNEGDAVAYAAGCALSGVRCAVLMQNSGLSNALSPLSSLNELFKLHVLLIIGNRGADDEPQHRIMAGAVKPLLKELGLPYFNAEDEGSLERATTVLDEHSAALLVNGRDTFSKVELAVPNDAGSPLRYNILKAVSESARDAVVVTTTGFTSREMYYVNDRPENFYMVGSMGCLSSFAAGIADSLPEKKVIAIDGDSACLMRLGALYTLTQKKPNNLCYIVLDNGVNESTGGQPNCRGESRLFDVMQALHKTLAPKTPGELSTLLEQFQANGGYTQIYVKIRVGTIEGLPRPGQQLIFGQAARFAGHIGRVGE